MAELRATGVPSEFVKRTHIAAGLAGYVYRDFVYLAVKKRVEEIEKEHLNPERTQKGK
jgi:hypothetical protein